MSFSDKKILVVEDDDMLRSIIVDQISKNFKVLQARDGEEAIHQIFTSRPNAIVLDLLLPKLNGFEVLAKLRTTPDRAIADIPVLVVSNLSDQASIIKTQQYNVLEYYVKSDITLGTLVDRLKKIFDPS